MAVNSLGKPVRNQSFNVSCTVGGTYYVLYTCPANCRAEVSMLLITNVSGTTQSIDCIWNDVSTAHAPHILGSKSLGNGDFILFTGATLVLEAGDSIQVKAGTSGTVHVDAMCTVTETFIPVG